MMLYITLVFEYNEAVGSWYALLSIPYLSLITEEEDDDDDISTSTVPVSDGTSEKSPMLSSFIKFLIEFPRMFI